MYLRNDHVIIVLKINLDLILSFSYLLRYLD